MNEYQVAYEKARREADLKNETKKALELLENHEAVVLLYVTRYCPYTDAILGTDISIAEVFDDIQLAEEFMSEQEGDSDFYYWMIKKQQPNIIEHIEIEEDIPF
jgi:hypothetical protein